MRRKKGKRKEINLRMEDTNLHAKWNPLRCTVYVALQLHRKP